MAQLVNRKTGIVYRFLIQSTSLQCQQTQLTYLPVTRERRLPSRTPHVA